MFEDLIFHICYSSKLQSAFLAVSGYSGRIFTDSICSNYSSATMPGGAGFRAAGHRNQQQQQQQPPPPGRSNVGFFESQPSSRPRSGGYDGPGEPSHPNPFGPGIGFDPAKPAAKERIITNTRVELPAAAYKLEGPSVCYYFDIRTFDCCLPSMLFQR
jgi:hypothetical protein